MRRKLILVLTGVLAAALLVALVVFADVSLGELSAALGRATGLHVPIILVGTMGHMVCSALKWRLVMKRLEPEATRVLGFSFFFFYSCLAASLAQFVPLYISSVAVRGIAARLHSRVSFLRGAMSSGYEQMLDVYVLVLLVLPTVAVLLVGGGPVAWGILAAGSVCVGGGILSLSSRATHPDSPTARAFARLSTSHLRPLRSMLRRARSFGLFDARLLLQLYGLALVRYVSMFVRVAVIAAGLFALPVVPDALYGFTLVQAMQIASLTPGNLGIAEWGWVGSLTAFGHPLDMAAVFAITLRLLAFVSILVMLAVAGVAFGLRGFARSNGSDEEADEGASANLESEQTPARPGEGRER